MHSLFDTGRNCFRVTRSRRAALLIDGEAYFKALVLAAQRAERTLTIIGWDFDTRVCLTPHEPLPGVPPLLGDFLNWLVRRRRGLTVRVLDWDYPMIFGTDREFPPRYSLGWKPARRVEFRYDNTHPLGGSHHQKLVVIDDALAFCGGLDLTGRRWDTCEHKGGDARRTANGEHYPPFHDVMAMVDGDTAAALGEVARERWREATGHTVAAARIRHNTGDPWPEEVRPDLTDVTVGVSRTLPHRPAQQGLSERQAVREVEALHLDMIMAARQRLYFENQYFTAVRLCDALAARLAEPDGPEVVLVLRQLSNGWLEEHTMTTLRSHLLGRLRAADRHGRLGVYYPTVTGLAEGTCVNVHAKIAIADDDWLRVGSANLANRSMGLDSECDLTFEARGEPRLQAAIAGVRNRLLGEHLGVPEVRFAEAHASSGSLNRAIAVLAGEGRTLLPLVEPPESDDVALNFAEICDMERPVSLDELVKEFAAPIPVEQHGPAWRTLLIFGAVVVGLMALWRYTPLAGVFTPQRVADYAEDIGSRWWAPWLLMAVYTPACVIMFPRPLITLFGVVAFGPWLGALYGLAGVLVAAVVTYAAGYAMDHATVGRIAGSRLNHITDTLKKRGLMAMTALRIVPIAPFSVENLVAGAVRVRISDYMLGTLLGLMPGTFATIVFGAQLQTAIRDPGEVNYGLLALVAAGFVVAVLLIRRFIFGGRFFQAPEVAAGRAAASAGRAPAEAGRVPASSSRGGS